MKIWSEHVTKDGKLYYYNKVTKQSLWEKPSDFDATTDTTETLNDRVEGKEKAMEWEELWDPKNERFYYFNRTTRKTQWQKPENVSIKPCTNAPSRKKKSEDVTTSNSTIGEAEKAEEKQEEPKPGKKEEKETSTIKLKEKEENQEREIKEREKVKSKNNTMMTLEQEEEQEEENDVVLQLLEKNNKKRKKKQKHNTTSNSSYYVNGNSSKKTKHQTSNQTTKGTSTSTTTTTTTSMIIVDDKYEEEEAQTNTQNQHQHQHQSNSTTSNVKNTFTKTKKDSRSFEEKNTKNGQEATRLLEELSQCDGIMEPNVLQIINGFLRTYKGNNGPELLVEKLSTSYRGRAQMIELVASWLDEMPISKNAMEKKIISFDGHAQMILPAGTSMTSNHHHLGMIDQKNNKTTATWQHADEMLYQYLKQRVKNHYEPKRLSNVLNDSAVEPEWLKQMLTEKKWRQMLIELAETHQTCSLLQYTIRRISEAGHHQEIAFLPIASAFYSVFNGILTDAFQRIPFESAEVIQEDLIGLKRNCTQNTLSFLYTQELLCTLDTKLYQQQMSTTSTNSISVNNYLRQIRATLNQVRLELQQATFHQFDHGTMSNIHTISRFSSSSINSSNSNSNSNSSSSGSEASEGGKQMEALHPLKRKALQQQQQGQGQENNNKFHFALLKLYSTRQCTEQILQTLVNCFSTTNSNPPPVAFLRDPIIFHCLLDFVFYPSFYNHHHQDDVSSICVQHCIHLLAYLACTKDDRSIIFTNHVSSNQPIETKNTMFFFEETKKALEKSFQICQSDHHYLLGYNMIHANEKMKKLNVLIEKNPIVSMGILYWLEKILASFSNGGHTGSGHRSGGIGGTSGTGGLELNGSLLSVCFPNFLKILRTSIRFHIAQWPFVFQVLVISLRIQQNVSTTTTTSTTGGSHSGSSTVGMTNNTTGSITTGSVSTGSSSNTMTLPNTSSTSGSSSTSSGDIGGGGGGGGVNTTTTNMMNPVKAFELKRQTLRCMVFMMINGYVLPVLEFIYKNIFELDLALLRYFICMVFEKIDAPFSKEFMFQVIQILMHPKVQNAIKTNCPIETKNKLKLFVLQCQKKNNNKEEEERFVLPEQLQALMALMST